MSNPTLLLHGWGGSARSSFLVHNWGQALEAVKRRIIAPDLPGHGSASTSIDPADYADLAGQIRATLPPGSLDVIGHSLGAKIALKLASEAPEKFRRVVAIGVGNNLFAREASGEAVARALETGDLADAPAGVRGLVTYSQSSGSNPKSLAAILRRPPNPVISAQQLRVIGARTLLINGSADRIAQPDAHLRAALPGLTYVLLQGLTHLQLVSAEAVRHIATRFLDLIDERDSPSAAAH